MAPSKDTLKCKAAVAFESNKPVQVVDVLIDPPKCGEIRIRVLANALCHTDVYTLSGSDPEGLFPCILGHEATGIVESIGDGVESVEVGDLVIPCYTPQCREYDCQFCCSSDTNLCPKIRATQGKGLMPDGTSRLRLASDPNQMIHHFMGCSTFAEFAVLAEISVAKINKFADPYKMCLLGCGISTGWGAVLNTCKVKPLTSVVVFGLGALGLSVIQACVKVGCSTIIGVDINDKKFESAKSFGATECLLSDEKLQEKLVKISKWGFDYTFDCTGNVKVMRNALELSHRGTGISCIIGVAPSGHEIATRPFQLVIGKSWIGTAFGGWKSRDEVPRLVEMVMRGEMNIDSFITHQLIGLEKMNEAVDVLHSGQCLRAVIKISDDVTAICAAKSSLSNNNSVVLSQANVSSVKMVSVSKLEGGLLYRLTHVSDVCKGVKMTFSVFTPEIISDSGRYFHSKRVPVIFYLSGLTCTDENARTKSGFAKYASEQGIAVVFPDTSPRQVPTESLEIDKDFDFGSGASFYVNSTEKPWTESGFQMFDYVNKELRELTAVLFPLDLSKAGIMGHSMGGHGALISHLKMPTLYKSVSTFAAICNPTECQWGRKAFKGYLGSVEAGREYDATCLMKRYTGPKTPILMDQGSSDVYLKDQLKPDNFLKACVDSENRDNVEYRMRSGYDHSYFFVSTFIHTHFQFHAKYLC